MSRTTKKETNEAQVRPVAAEPAVAKVDSVPKLPLLHTALLLGLLLVTASSVQNALAPLYGQLLISQAITYATLFAIGIVELLRSVNIPLLPVDGNAILSLIVSLMPALLDLAPKTPGAAGEPRTVTTTAFVLVPPLVSIVWCLRRVLDRTEALDQPSIRSLGTSILLAGSVTTAQSMVSVTLQNVTVALNLVSHLLIPLITANAITYLFTPRASRRTAFLSMSISTAVIFSTVYGPAGNLASLNRRLSADPDTTSWSIVDRQWSNTGYLSVLENSEAGYRLLRCDHSFLGGEWLPPNTSPVGEPVYVVFTILEAVRLIDRPEPRSEKTALVIGLGVGSAPKALLAHGLDTTIIELDPVVHNMATKYFSLPSNHTSVIADAESWVGAQSSLATTKKYDYIIHDVFTGGYEPLNLFTSEFLRNLRTLLAPGGAIAINYAGDTDAPLTLNVLHTVRDVFGTTCRIFKDMDPPEPDADAAKSDPTSSSTSTSSSSSSTFANLVIFCLPDGAGSAGRKMDDMIADPAHRKPFYFRGTKTSDFLGSRTRKEFLMPRAQLEIKFPAADAGAASTAGLRVLTAATVARFRKQQALSALRHWKIMRLAVPSRVWEIY